jgi:hypothetical protein
MAVNQYLMSLALAQLEKVAVVPPGGGDPAAMGGMPADPAMMDPAMMGAVPPAAPGDPAAAMAAMSGPVPAPAPAPAPATPTSQPGQQKLKPEQMMQMLDYRLYNMQQQLTAIMNAMGVNVAPESLVLPPGTTGAPPAETALPGGPMAPPPPQQPPADPAAMGGMPADPAAAAMPPDMAKGAGAISDLYTRAAALNILRRSLESHAG